MWWLMASAARTFYARPKHPRLMALLWAFCPMAAWLWREGYQPSDEPGAPWVWGLLRRLELEADGARLADRMAEWGLGNWTDLLRLAVDRAERFRQKFPRWRAAERSPLFREILEPILPATLPAIPPPRAAVGWSPAAMLEALLALAFLYEDLAQDLAEAMGGPFRLRPAWLSRDGASWIFLEATPTAATGGDRLLLIPLDADPAWLTLARRAAGETVAGIGERGELIVDPGSAAPRLAALVEELEVHVLQEGPPPLPLGLAAGLCGRCGYRTRCPAWKQRHPQRTRVFIPSAHSEDAS
jgi:hypothetical protein